MKRFAFELNGHEIGFLTGVLVPLIRSPASGTVLHLLHRLDEVARQVYDNDGSSKDFAGGVAEGIRVDLTSPLEPR